MFSLQLFHLLFSVFCTLLSLWYQSLGHYIKMYYSLPVVLLSVDLDFFFNAHSI